MRGAREIAAVLASFLLLVGSPGCGGALSAAKADYRKGRSAEAKVELVALEADSHRWSPQRRAEYALYRGLVHESLGDRAAAGVWLAEASALDATAALDPEDRVRLKLALESLTEGTAPPSP